jgi:hypothetical protein
MADLDDVVNAIEDTNSILQSIGLKIDDVNLKLDGINLLLSDQALHNQNVELFFVEVKDEFLLMNEKLQLINDSQGGYLKEEVLSNNDWYYNQVSEINEKLSYNFVFLGVVTGIVFAFMVVSAFLRKVL